MSKSKSYLKRVAMAAQATDARAELSAAALQALAGNLDRMPATVFNELSSKGYLVCEKRGWKLSPKAIAFQTHANAKAI